MYTYVSLVQFLINFSCCTRNQLSVCVFFTIPKGLPLCSALSRDERENSYNLFVHEKGIGV